MTDRDRLDLYRDWLAEHGERLARLEVRSEKLERALNGVIDKLLALLARERT